MKINEVITEKERVDEVLPAVIGGAVRMAPYVWKGIKHVLPYLKKVKGIGTKAHMAGEIGKKIVKKSPPTPGDGSEIDKTAMVPGPQAYHKQVAPKQVARPAVPPVASNESISPLPGPTFFQSFSSVVSSVQMYASPEVELSHK